MFHDPIMQLLCTVFHGSPRRILCMRIGVRLLSCGDPPRNSFLVRIKSVFEKLNEFLWHNVTIPCVPLMLQHSGDSRQSAGACKPSFFFPMTLIVHVFKTELHRKRRFKWRILGSVAGYPSLHCIQTLLKLCSSGVFVFLFSAFCSKFLLIVALHS